MVDTSDLLPKTPRYLKVPLIILNTILWILGILLIALGGYSISQLSNLKQIINISIPAGLVVIGVFFVILTVIGCLVAYKEKLVGLVIYTVFMLILLVCLIGVGGGAFSYRKDVETPLWKAWQYATNDELNFVEGYFKCCSFSPEHNSINNTGTNCRMTNPANETVRNDSYPFCKDIIVDYIKKNLYIAGAAGVAIGVIEFISMLFALFLIVRICNSPRSKSYD